MSEIKSITPYGQYFGYDDKKIDYDEYVKIFLEIFDSKELE